MNCLVIADPKIPVPPHHYGGAERIVAQLCAGLQQRGHRVDLLAGPGSRAFGGTLTIHRTPGASRWQRAWAKARFLLLARQAARGADVVINFGRLDYLQSLLPGSLPLVCVFQNPIPQSEMDWLRARRQHGLALVGVSAAQVATLQPPGLFSVVHNGTDVERFQFQERPATPPYLAFLGRITHNKGADTAIRVARRTGLPLKLAGTISDEPGGREFFAREIEPNLGGGIEYVGPVDDAQKQALLGGASAFLFPIRWPEPFGIVMAESLACGTPVIATRCASTPEVIEDGSSGFLCDSEEAMVEAVRKIPSIDRHVCRKVAEDRFSVSTMVNGYLRIMERLIGSDAAPSA